MVNQDLQSSFTSCFEYDNCPFNFSPCHNNSLHPESRYEESSAAWVLISAIIVFLMKAGFMLMEMSFARSPQERRYVVVLKHQDAFASALAFFLFGYNRISQYTSLRVQTFVNDPVLWFFKFTFASNAATIVGGCLVTNRYKLRIPAAFISAFVISGIIHPFVARMIWSDHCDTFSPYRFCNYMQNPVQSKRNCTSWDCSADINAVDFWNRFYILDFAGGGAVHLIGGMAGLVLCLFAKFNEWRYSRGNDQQQQRDAELPEEMNAEVFWDWMYPAHGGEESVSEAALGVILLWFSWFAFNCGSAESVDTGFKISKGMYADHSEPFYEIPALIAINMIIAGASGGMVAIAIACWAQVRYRTASVNANRVANGIISALVSITAGCAFVDYWGAALIGFIGVLVYHFGCFLEYLLKIKDTARVVPVHGLCGLWSVIATGLFVVETPAQCNLHATFEGLCYCILRLPPMTYVEHLGAQIIGALFMIGVGLVGSFVTYFILYVIPIGPCVSLLEKVFCLSPKRSDGTRQKLVYRGGWLLSHPDEDIPYVRRDGVYSSSGDAGQSTSSVNDTTPLLVDGGEEHMLSSTFGTMDSRTIPIIGSTITNPNLGDRRLSTVISETPFNGKCDIGQAENTAQKQ